jgi:hypothetical protein
MNKQPFFDGVDLTSIEVFDNALIAFKYSLQKETFERDLASLLEDSPQVLPLVLSSDYLSYNLWNFSDTLLLTDIDEQDVPFQKWILNSFPLQPEIFIGSLHHELLTYLSYFFLFFPPTAFDREVRRNLHVKHRAIRKAPTLLDCVSQLNFEDESAFAEEDWEVIDLTQKQRKKRERAATGRPIVPDQKLFDQVKREVPKCHEEAKALVDRVLDEQKSYLEVCTL